MYHKSICIITLIMTIGLMGCHHNDIKLQKVTQTSEYLYCDKVFAADRKSITELNEILLQTGVIDTLDDTTVRAAVIHVNNQEEIINLAKSEQNGEVLTETYAGKVYKVILNYELDRSGYITAYKGSVEIWKGPLYSKLEIHGLRNKL